MSTPEAVAAHIDRAFHEAYEALAPDYGYKTREASAKPWHEVPEQNRALMTATVQRLLDRRVIIAAEAGRPAPPPFRPDRILIGYIEDGQVKPAD